MKKHFIKLGFIISLVIVVNCNNDDDGTESLCIQSPCGTIDELETNITINIDELVNINNVSEEITNVSLKVDDTNIPIDVSGINIQSGSFYSCWATIPSNNITSLNFTLNETEYELPFEDSLSSNILELVILQSDDEYFIDIYSYVECDDTPDS